MPINLLEAFMNGGSLVMWKCENGHKFETIVYGDIQEAKRPECHCCTKNDEGKGEDESNDNVTTG